MREVLKQSSDPTARSYLIHRFAPLALDPKVVWNKLESEEDVSIRRALLLGLGEVNPSRLAPAARDSMILQLVHWFRDDPDPGIHGAQNGCCVTGSRTRRLLRVNKELVTERWRAIDFGI